MKWKELIKIATEKGYRFYAHGKKHDIYVNDQGERLIIEKARLAGNPEKA